MARRPWRHAAGGGDTDSGAPRTCITLIPSAAIDRPPSLRHVPVAGSAGRSLSRPAVPPIVRLTCAPPTTVRGRYPCRLNPAGRNSSASVLHPRARLRSRCPPDGRPRLRPGGRETTTRRRPLRGPPSSRPCSHSRLADRPPAAAEDLPPRGTRHRRRATTTTSVETNAVIDHVVDGDTVDVRIDGRTERVRLIGINTPETKDPAAGRVLRPRGLALTSPFLPAGTGVRLSATSRPGRLRAAAGPPAAQRRVVRQPGAGPPGCCRGALDPTEHRARRGHRRGADEARRAHRASVPFLADLGRGRPPGAVGRPTDSVGPRRTTTGRRWSSASATGPRTSSSSAATTSACATR